MRIADATHHEACLVRLQPVGQHLPQLTKRRGVENHRSRIGEPIVTVVVDSEAMGCVGSIDSSSERDRFQEPRHFGFSAISMLFA